jgi:ABC-type sugar transport system ATPase subunit
LVVRRKRDHHQVTAAAVPAPAARLIGIDKWFGGAHALRGVSVAFETGDVHAVAGENGAGKSTLMKILSGVIPASEYSGTLEIDGVPRRLSSIREAEHHGIFLVPQELNVVPELRVGEYMFLNREPRRFGLVDTRQLWTETARWLDVFKLRVSPLARMGELSTHEQQLVSIARAMTQGVKLLILDEPTASLTERETELLFAQMQDLHRHGVTAIYISHRLQEFERVADVCTVMRDGSVVETFRLDEAGGDVPRRVIRAMVGRDLSEMYPKVAAKAGLPLLTLAHWSVAHTAAGRPDVVRDVSLELRAGEVLGVYGLLGSGAFQLARSLFGASSGAVRGSMLVRGKPVRMGSPIEAMRHGIAYLPAERKRDSLILSHSIATNMSLAALSRLSRWGAVDRRAELTSIQRYLRDLRVRYSSAEQPIRELSGGNQQKVVAAKWLLLEPDVFVLEEPTRGVDVNARVDFYALMNRLTAAGKALVLVSTDLPEVLGMADRILVMWEGQIVSEFRRGQVSEEQVMLQAAGEHEMEAA